MCYLPSCKIISRLFCCYLTLMCSSFLSSYGLVQWLCCRLLWSPWCHDYYNTCICNMLFILPISLVTTLATHTFYICAIRALCINGTCKTDILLENGLSCLLLFHYSIQFFIYIVIYFFFIKSH